MPAVTKTRQRTKPAEERRDDLLDAAQRLFLEHGFGPTTIEQITRASDVAKGTFYLYFKSKDEVRTALGERFAQSHLAAAKAGIAKRSSHDWPGKLIGWASASVGFYLEFIRLHDVLFYEGRSPTREGLVDNVVIGYLAEILQEGVSAGAWAVDDCRSTAVFLFSGIHGVVDDAYTKAKRVDKARLARRLARLCRSAVGVSLD
jgi:AcrR family transcriptional regulator